MTTRSISLTCVAAIICSLCSGLNLNAQEGPSEKNVGLGIVPETNLDKLPVRPVQGSRTMAILIGVQNYKNFPKLKYSERDVLLLEKTLKESCDVELVKVMLESSQYEANRPTFAQMENTLKRWFAAANIGIYDRLLVYFSGHGYQDDKEQLYLVPIDCAVENIKQFGLPISRLRGLIDSCDKVKTKMLFLDCCFAGSDKGNAGSASAEAIAIGFQGTEGLLTFASSANDESSLEWDEKQHSLFTYWLCEGLSGRADADHDGLVDDLELYKYTFFNVMMTASDMGRSQTVVRRESNGWAGYSVLGVAPGASVAEFQPPPRLARPTPVALSVSVPELRGASRVAIEQTLNRLGLKARFDEGRIRAPLQQFSQVAFEQIPPAGSKINVGGEVLVMLYGSYTVKVPDLKGLSVEAATQRLTSIGLAPDLTTGTKNPLAKSLAKTTYEQTPAAGQEVAPGTKVSIAAYGTYVPVVPDLKGKTSDLARKELRELGLAAVIVLENKRPEDAADAGKIYKQVPAAGSTFKPGQEVRAYKYSDSRATSSTASNQPRSQQYDSRQTRPSQGRTNQPRNYNQNQGGGAPQILNNRPVLRGLYNQYIN